MGHFAPFFIFLCELANSRTRSIVEVISCLDNLPSFWDSRPSGARITPEIIQASCFV